jgi:hypothetical protein
MERDEVGVALWRQWSALRIYGLVVLAGLTISLRSEGLAWASVLHFLLKYLGAYHGCRLAAWGVTLGWALIKVLHPPRP